MREDEWEIELRKELGDIISAPPRPVTPEKSPLPLAIFFLSIALVFTYVWKTDPTWFGFRRHQEPPPIVAGDPLKDIRDDLAKIRQSQDKLSQDISTLQKRVQIHGDRILMLGCITNENAMGQRYNDRDPLYLNQDWSIPREPRYLKNDPADVEWFKQRVNPPK